MCNSEIFSTVAGSDKIYNDKIMSNKQYDVFISSKSEDYPIAREICSFLEDKGYAVFFAEKSIPFGADSLFKKTIDYALDAARNMIVVCSNPEFLEDGWVYYEWNTFSVEILSGRKPKSNILTVLDASLSVSKMPIGLRSYQSLCVSSYQETICDYLGNPSQKTENEPQEAFSEITTPETIIDTSSTEQIQAIFKFYSNENCEVFKEGKLACCLEGMSDKPYHLPVSRKGDYRFKCINAITQEEKMLKVHIDAEEEKDVDIFWEEHHYEHFKPTIKKITDNIVTIELGYIKFEMIRVEGGSMVIGATEEQQCAAEKNEFPAHNITLSTFYMGKFPVTQNLWEFVMGYNKSYFKNKEDTITDVKNLKLEKILTGAMVGSVFGPLGTIAGGIRGAKGWFFNENINIKDNKGHYPVENVTYDEAQEFVRRLSKMTNIKFSLPTEEEWEYAARGGQQTKNYQYAGSNDINDVAWYKYNSEHSTQPVGSKKPNELGLYDMCGNVWEWTETPAHSYSIAIEAQGDIFIRRGGSWWHETKNCRVSRRYASHRSKKTSGLGLRVIIRENIE